ncbi:MAG: serine/threonine-protein kinase [Candidatus Methylacidiphilales bacterium]|nr:serine/threonine-protein kinase [Candidatus Methylacidiphilales bacterium]
MNAPDSMPSPSANALWIAGRYRLLAPIGVGGLGVVYSGWDHELNRPVAVKRLKERPDASLHALIEESFNEGRALASLRHPHVVRFYDFGIDKAGPYFVMERIDGETLHERIQGPPVSVNEFCQIARMSLEGLAAAHRLGIIHLDMKPSNIILHPTSDGRPSLKLLDFGLSKLHRDVPHEPDQTGSVYGTYLYVAPEQVTLRPLGPRTDLYSLGHVLYHLLARQPAFFGPSVPEVLAMHVNQDAPSILNIRPDMGTGLAIWLHQLMQRDPARRPESAEEAILQLSRSERTAAAAAAEQDTSFLRRVTNQAATSASDWIGAKLGRGKKKTD